jgi:hypothetical protein
MPQKVKLFDGVGNPLGLMDYAAIGPPVADSLS